MNNKIYKGHKKNLRSAERKKFLQVDKVVDICMEGLESGKILDVGTGTGLFAQAFSRPSVEVSGIDINPEFLKEAENLVPQASFYKACAEKLPFADKSFDIVFMGHLLHESEDPLRVLSEARRVLLKKLAILEWPYEDQDFGPPVHHRISGEKIKKLSLEAGFSDFKAVEVGSMRLYICKG